MPGRFIVMNDQRVLLVDDHLSDRELRFARGCDGELDPRYALEVAIDLVSEPPGPVDAKKEHSRSFSSRFSRRRLPPLGGVS